MSAYNPYEPPTTAAVPATRASRLVTVAAVLTLIIGALFSAFTAAVFFTLTTRHHDNLMFAWAFGLYFLIGALWTLAAGIGLLRRRNWGWWAAVSYLALTTLVFSWMLWGARWDIERSGVAGALPAFVFPVVAILILVLLSLRSVRRQFSAGGNGLSALRT